MTDADRETPGLCKNCRQWLCANKDSFCACCGIGLVVAALSNDRLVFPHRASALSLTISNPALFRLYWAAEVIAPEARMRDCFSLVPDYGIIAPGEQQSILIKLLPREPEIRAYLEIASNDPRRPEIKIELVVVEED